MLLGDFQLSRVAGVTLTSGKFGFTLDFDVEFRLSCTLDFGLILRFDLHFWLTSGFLMLFREFLVVIFHAHSLSFFVSDLSISKSLSLFFSKVLGYVSPSFF